jgi:hypothetical protein
MLMRSTGQVHSYFRRDKRHSAGKYRPAKLEYVEHNGDMEIEVRVKTITMSAPMHKKGIFLFLGFAFSFDENVFAGPVDVVGSQMRLSKKGETSC